MIIRKIRMVNFRGFFEKNIDFQDKTVVLLSAANGIGKTTTIDAIEWCLTGDIGRLKNNFESRSTNEGDRKKNAAGILKNRNAGKNKKVKVELSLYDGEKEIVLCREQQKDVLNPDYSIATIDESEEKAEEFLQKYIGDRLDRKSFYNFHFCDVQKSFNVQSAKKDKLKDLFEEFITNYDVQKQIAENLDIFAEDVGRHIEDVEKQKVTPEMVKLKEEHLAKAREGAKNIPYPETIFYPEEKTAIESLNQEELITQQRVVRNCGFLMAKEALDKLVKNEALRRQRSVIQEIVSYWETKGDSIQRAVRIGFLKNSDAITARERKLVELKELSFSKDTILQEGALLIALENAGFTQSDFEADQRRIVASEKKVSELSAEIDLLSKNNKMLKLLSDLSTSHNKQMLIEYQNSSITENGFVRCPVCGSESFADIEPDSILKEADDYIRQNNEVVKAKTEDQTSLQVQVDALYQKIIQRAKNVVQEELQKLSTEISDLQALKREVQPYFDAAKNLQKILHTIQIEELTAEKSAELLTDAEHELLEESQEQATRAEYQQLLTVLGYQFEYETIQETHAKVGNLITDVHKVLDFSYDLFVSKLNSIDSILANQVFLSQKQELDKIYEKNKELDAQISELHKLKDTASQRARDIQKIIDQLSKDEYEKVGPALSKFYNKLARFNVADGIHIKLENGGISLVDNNDKNIVNVLSNGQISVFMLAYFFAGINVRNDHEKMKIYFIDDLTACMDDVNMLAFMDLLKYQIASNSIMEQLFFITCDDRISKLLKYKLSGRGVELCELIEADFVE